MSRNLVGQHIYATAAANGKRVQALTKANTHALVMKDAGIEKLHVSGNTCHSLGYCANLDHQFSEVLSLKQSDEGIGSAFKPLHNILAIFDLPCG